MSKKNSMPTYLDGAFELYSLTRSKKGDFVVEQLTNQNMTIAYREMAVYDSLRIELQKDNIDPTYKIRIPRFKLISTESVLLIDGKYNRVISVSHTFDKSGFPETELLTKSYEVNRYD